MMFYEDGQDAACERVIESKDANPHHLDNIGVVHVRAYDTLAGQFIALRVHGQRIYMDEKQVLELFQLLHDNEIIV